MEKEGGWRRNKDGEGMRMEKESEWRRNQEGEGIRI